MIPHYTQTKGSPAIQGAGEGVFACSCGESPLIAGYTPRNFLNIAIRCGACGAIAETPGVPADQAPPQVVMILERGGENAPGPFLASVVLISREEMDRLTALYLPRKTDDIVHALNDAFIDEIEAGYRTLTGETLDPAPPPLPRAFKETPIAWAAAHLRLRLRDPDWGNFDGSPDTVAMALLSGFRDFIAGWSHHPLFPAMARTVASQGFTFHALAPYWAAKALTASGNRIGFVPTEAIESRIAAMRVALTGQDDLSITVSRFDRFEWPDGAPIRPDAVRAAVVEAMAGSQGYINRLRPGILILSGGANEGTFDQLLVDTVAAAIVSHGKRYRGLAAVGAIFPKIELSRTPREARFGFAFYPQPNHMNELGRAIRSTARPGA